MYYDADPIKNYQISVLIAWITLTYDITSHAKFRHRSDIHFGALLLSVPLSIFEDTYILGSASMQVDLIYVYITCILSHILQ